MGILSDEIKLYKSAVVSDASTNGGRMSGTNEITSNIKNNLWDDVDETERASGSTKYRKLFFKNANDDDYIYSNARIHMTDTAQGDDYATFFEGTQSDTQADISSPREYGVAQLKTNVSAGATSFVVTAEASGMAIIQTGDTVWIGDGTNKEYHEDVTVTPSGYDFTIALDAGDQLANSYVTTNTFSSSVIESGDIKTSYSGWVETSPSGTYDETNYPPVLDNIGTVYDTWTITFTDATNFTCAGASEGSVGSGSTGGDFSPTNSDFTKPYFTILASGWGGTWAVGDTVVFVTSPSAVPIWQKRIVPAGATTVSTDDYTMRIRGETAGTTSTTTTTTSSTTTTTAP